MTHLNDVPDIRVRACNDAPLRASGRYVLYWMIASRRTRYNFALDRALAYCAEFDKPLVIFEGLRSGYQWASDRLHRFVIQGMRDNQEACEQAGVLYIPYVEPEIDAGKGLLKVLADNACVVVTDDFPTFMLPRMVAAAGKQLGTRLEAIDSNGLLPMRAAPQVYPTAYAFRRYIQKTILSGLPIAPRKQPLTRYTHGLAKLPSSVSERWPRAQLDELLKSEGLATLPIDHHVLPVPYAGGAQAARKQLTRFIAKGLPYYLDRNLPEEDIASGLSPYLHFGHIATHDIFERVTAAEDWSIDKLASKATGQREGFWRMSAPAEGFLDQIITWRELGYNFAGARDDYDQYDSLPDWAQRSLQKHASDKRQFIYSLAEFEEGRTHDPLWNAAQMQIVREGRIHNYLRMLWGKKILEWSKSPRDALATMIELNNKYGVDGRNPNSYSGIFWTLGRYDRPWAPERPIFGVIRYMSSDNTARKMPVKNYISTHSPG